MRINIINLSRKTGVSRSEVRNVVFKVLEFERINPENIEVCITFAKDKQMIMLNDKYLGKKKSTDVLAFNMNEGMDIGINNGFLGDIIIGVDTAIKQSKEYKTSVKKEILLYIIHGMLHLLGYNDCLTKDRVIMDKKQESILNLLLF